MSEIEECEQRLKEARALEKQTFIAAAAAVKEAVRARKRALYAWVDLAKAKGSTEDFRKTYEETAILQWREDQGCGEYVAKAMQTGMFSRLGL
jgi:hypothetical protein